MSEEDLWNTIEADAEAFKDLTTEAGTELAALIRQLGVVQSSVWETEEKLKGLKQQRDRYLHDLIPAKMQETGLDEVKVDGNKVSLATFVSGTMPKDPLEGFDTAAKTWVEPQTPKKLIRERVEAGQEIDLEIFNAHIGTIAKIRGE